MERIQYIVLLIMALQGMANAQSYTSIWVGRAETQTSSTYNTYLCDLEIKKKGNAITGKLHYYFGQNEFTTPLTGKFWPATRTIEFNPFGLITFFSRDQNGPDCMMDGSLTLYVDGKDSVLFGQLNPLPKHKLGCPVMQIRLQKEVIKEEEGDKEGLEEKDAGQTEITVDTGTLILPPPVPNPPKALPSLSEPVPDTLINAFANRTFSTGPIITVSSDTVQLHLYDNGRVDNDSVSVFFNRRPVWLHIRLNTQPVIIHLVLEKGENEIALFADNLGEIPPNTALCIIYAGGERYDINLSSNYLTNGTVRIRKKDGPN